MSFWGKLQGLGCRDLKIRTDEGGGWGLRRPLASGKFLTLGRIKDVKDEDNIQMEFWSISVLVRVKPHGWYRSHKVYRTGLEKGREKRVSHICVAVGQRRGARAAVVGEMEWGLVQGELAAGSGYENANPWEFTCVLWESLDYPEYSQWVLGPKGEGNLVCFWALLSWVILHHTWPDNSLGATEHPK